jgi:hypothetical protein
VTNGKLHKPKADKKKEKKPKRATPAQKLLTKPMTQRHS